MRGDAAAGNNDAEFVTDIIRSLTEDKDIDEIHQRVDGEMKIFLIIIICLHDLTEELR